MKVFYDTEFLEDGHTIELISIGMVANDGTAYYAVNADMPWDRILKHPWLMENVINQLPTKLVNGMTLLDHGHKEVIPYVEIKRGVYQFLKKYEYELELWAYYASYDHVALCQLFGRMIDLPPFIPMYTNDLKQELVRYEFSRLEMPKHSDDEHNALADARWNMNTYNWLVGQAFL